MFVFVSLFSFSEDAAKLHNFARRQLYIWIYVPISQIMYFFQIYFHLNFYDCLVFNFTLCLGAFIFTLCLGFRLNNVKYVLILIKISELRLLDFFLVSSLFFDVGRKKSVLKFQPEKVNFILLELGIFKRFLYMFLVIYFDFSRSRAILQIRERNAVTVFNPLKQFLPSAIFEIFEIFGNCYVWRRFLDIRKRHSA